jgi:hypothetical protein
MSLLSLSNLAQTICLNMNDNYSCIGVPSTTQEVIAKEHPDHTIESSETHTLAGPEAPAAPNLSAPTLVCPFLLLIAQNLTSWS